MLLLILGQIPSKVLTADDVLSPYVYVFYAAFVVSFLFTPAMRSVALYYGIIDYPDRLRKIHGAPVAYLGGVAVFLGWMAGLTMSQFLKVHRPEAGLLPFMMIRFSIVIGACMIVVLGLWDDVKGLRPSTKIAGQIAASAFLLLEGVGTRCTASLLGPIDARLQLLFGWPPIPEWFIAITSSLLVTAIVVGCCNATNLMDGLDGLCSGVTAIIAAGFLFLAVHLAMGGLAINSNWDALRIVLGLALLGAVLGFIPYNFNPASIFMGDTGSMFLGFACATMIILLGQEQPKWFLAAMVMFALPILDTSLAFVRRWVNGRPLFSADRHHFHHQLVARGYTIKKTVLISYGLAIGFGLLGVAIVFVRTRYAGAIYLVIFGSVIVAAFKMGMVHEQSRAAPPRPLGSKDAAESWAQPIEAGNVMEIHENEIPVVNVVGQGNGPGGYKKDGL